MTSAAMTPDEFFSGSEGTVSPQLQASRDTQAMNLLQRERNLPMPPQSRANLEKEIQQRGGKVTEDNPPTAMSADDFFAGTAPSKSKPVGSSLDTPSERRLMANSPDATDPEAPKRGFAANVNTDMRDAWFDKSLPANLLKSFLDGSLWKFLNKPGGAKELKQGWENSTSNVDWHGLAQSAWDDPGKFGAELVNAFTTDPELIFIPWGLGGKVAQALGKVASIAGPNAAKAGVILGKMTEAATQGGAQGGAIEAAKQIRQNPEAVDYPAIKSAAKAGAVMGAPLGILGKAKLRESPKAVEPEPQVFGQGNQTMDQVINESLGVKDGAGVVSPEAGAERAAELKALKADIRKRYAQDPSEADQMVRQVDAQVNEREQLAQQFQRQQQAQEAARSAQSDATVAAGKVLRENEGAQAEADRMFNAGQQLRMGIAPQNILEDVAWGDVHAILNKPPFQRTATDLITLRRFQNKGQIDKRLLMGMGAAAGAAALPLFIPEGRLKEFGSLGALIAMGAVKGKEGMWHPEAVSRLSMPLKETLNREARNEPSALASGAWADKAVKNYLNKHAGTESDPLKDVVLPSGKRWEEVTDKALKSSPARMYDKPLTDEIAGLTQRDPALKNVPADEAVWHIGDRSNVTGGRVIGEAERELTGHLSHVGDYLRQNVPPEKLGQYDLVRAVKETDARDLLMKKQMKKAAASSMKDMPVYKDYGDGMKWVELKLAEKLTEEQRARIIPSKADESSLGAKGFVALDAEGKPIRNSYTGDSATAKTPHEAHLAGQLAQEGNQMGHCVGGYCADVASGATRILSLRDAKGQSHVTVEIEPAGAKRFPGDTVSPKTLEDRIAQIKGKQNRAPNAKYLPYVQDLVKGGKWGEVGDLANADMVKLDKENMNVNSPLFKQDYITSKELFDSIGKGDYQPPATANRLPPGGPRGQRGSIDPRLLKGLAAAGVGALAGSWLADQDRLGGAVVGALGALLAGKYAPSLAHAADVGLGMVSTRMRNISPEFMHQARKFEYNVMTQGYRLKSMVDPFLTHIQKLPQDARDAMNSALLRNDVAGIRKIIADSKNKALAEALPAFFKAFTETGEKLKSLGRIKELLEGYVPRIVKDYDGLMNALGSQAKGQLEKMLGDANMESKAKLSRELNDTERSAIINQWLRDNYYRGRGQPGFAKGRRIDEITPELEQFYMKPVDAIHSYLARAVADIEKAKFFGKNVVNQTRNKQTYVNDQASISKVVESELAKGKITYAQAEDLRGMLQDRLAERATPGWLQEAKNWTNIGLLANFRSAIMQTGDVMSSIYFNGFRPTLEGVAQILTGKNHISAHDMGLANHISEEFLNTRRSAQLVNSLFKVSGFSLIDMMGKSTILNAAWNKFTRMAKTADGINKLREQWAPVFGQEFPDLVRDLQNGVKTDKTMMLLFHQLSDAQPISRLETTQFRMKHPVVGGIPLYLKSFVLKQADVFRRDAYNKIKEGKIREGIGNLVKFGAVLSLSQFPAQAIKDWMSGREFNPAWSDLWMNIPKTFGWSQYTLDQYKKGDVAKTTASLFVPPYEAFDNIVKRDPKAIQYLPGVGPILYDRYFGGNVAKAKAQARADRAARQDPDRLKYMRERRQQRDALRYGR